MPFDARPEASAIAAAVSSGKTSAVAVARSALDRIAAYAAVQPAVWIFRCSVEDVLASAAQVDQRVAAGETLPLAGVPFAIGQHRSCIRADDCGMPCFCIHPPNVRDRGGAPDRRRSDPDGKNKSRPVRDGVEWHP